MPEDLHRSALETFLGFEDLNSLDKAEAVFRQVKQDTGLDPDKAFTLLNTCLRAIERSEQIKELGKLVDISPDLQVAKLQALGVTDDVVLQLLLSILQMGLNPTSVKTQLLPMLSLPEDLKKAVREKGLKGAHALILATLSAKALQTDEEVTTKERIAATQAVLSENLNVAKTRELLSKIKAKYASNIPVQSKKIKSLIKNLDTVLGKEDFQSASPEQLTELRQKLAKALEILDTGK
jgi:ParB family transcriptional regulator, chromosome partitioning protein